MTEETDMEGVVVMVVEVDTGMTGVDLVAMVAVAAVVVVVIVTTETDMEAVVEAVVAAVEEADTTETGATVVVVVVVMEVAAMAVVTEVAMAVVATALVKVVQAGASLHPAVTAEVLVVLGPASNQKQLVPVQALGTMAVVVRQGAPASLDMRPHQLLVQSGAVRSSQQQAGVSHLAGDNNKGSGLNSHTDRRVTAPAVSQLLKLTILTPAHSSSSRVGRTGTPRHGSNITSSKLRPQQQQANTAAVVGAPMLHPPRIPPLVPLALHDKQTAGI